MPKPQGSIALVVLLVTVPMAGCQVPTDGSSPVNGSQDDGTIADGEPIACAEAFKGQRTHEHARVEVYLNSSRPFDFSPDRYQLAHRSLHFEAGALDAGGATIHIHEARPTVGCLLETLGWTVNGDRLVTDRGEIYRETGEHSFEVFVDGQPSKKGFDTPLRGNHRVVLRYNSSAPPTPCPGLTGHTIHEHAELSVRLNSSEPWDFSPARYQRQAGFVHFEDGEHDANGARIHVHQARPSLECLFSTLAWEVSQHRIETDVGEIYEAKLGTPIEVLVNGEPARDGFASPIRRAYTYEVRYNASANGSPTNASAE